VPPPPPQPCKPGPTCKSHTQADLARAGVAVESPPPAPAPLPEAASLYSAALLAAVKEGNAPAAETLLAHAANPNAVDAATGDTPLFYAVESQQELLPILLESASFPVSCLAGTRLDAVAVVLLERLFLSVGLCRSACL
jgi:hypothetical protein